MNDVITFFFTIQRQLWAVIVSSWILSSSVLIGLLGLIISLVNNSKGSQG